MKDFDWQSDEEDLWKDQNEVVAVPEPPRRRRWWAGLLAIMLVVGLVGGLIYRQLNRRVEEAVSSLEEDVAAAFGVVRSAADRRDRELLVSVISGRYPRWTSTQKELLEAGYLLDRAPFGLWLQPAAPRIVSVELSADLSQAILVAEQVYATQSAEGVTETVRLQQTAVFRQGDQRWLFAPPNEDFWGSYALLTGDYLTLEVPERDREIGVRLAADLDAAVEKMCQTLAEIECPAEPELFVRLETEPETWLDATDPANRLTAGHTLILPTPSLLGLPADEAAYLALLRGYSEQVLAPYIAELVGYECCNDHFLFYEALLLKQLNELGIRPWPLGPAEYEQLARGPLELGALSEFWFLSLAEATPLNRAYALAAVEFTLREGTDVTPAAMQRSLATRQSFWRWFQQWFERSPVNSGLLPEEVYGRRWLQFVNDQTLSAQQPPPVPLPDEDIALLCGSDVVLGLYRYDLASEAWQHELDGRTFLSMVPLLDDSGLVLEERFLSESNVEWKRILLWQEGQEISAYEGPLRAGLLAGFHGEDPAGQFLRIYTYFDASGPPSFLYLNMGQCDANGCPQQSVSGLPIWSPDGKHTLIWEFLEAEAAVVIGDANAIPLERLNENAFAPFWLDNFTIGYLYLADDGSQQVRIASIDDLQSPQTVLTLEDLRQAIPEAEQSAELSFNYAAAAPDDPFTLYLAVNNLDDIRPKVYIFSYRRPDLAGMPTPDPTSSYSDPARLGEATLLISADDSFATYAPFQFSPNGRWLTTVTSGWRHPARLFFLHDRTTGQTQQFESSPTFPHYDWSADGQWLLRVEEGYMSLTAPAYDYHRLLFYDQPQCGFPAWVKSER